MEIICGKKASSGIAEGELYVARKERGKVTRTKVDDPAAETEKYRRARTKVSSELSELIKRTRETVGEDEAQIFEIHKMMLWDEDFDQSIVSMIRWQAVNAEYAVSATADNLARIFTEMSGDYMKARAADIHDVAKRLTEALEGKDETFRLTAPVIIAAEDLTPGETVNFDKDLALGFITELGSDNSHSAILARTMGIPAVVAAGRIDPSFHGKRCIIDGTEGKLYVDPDPMTRRLLLKRKEESEKRAASLEALRNHLSVTKDGKRIKVYANIGDINDAKYAYEGDAEGIGLFRSEFLYMKNGALPGEEEQFNAYKTVGEKMGGREIIVRTLDAGADKQIGYLNAGNEANPALGLRAIRLCLSRQELFLTQLRALYRASAYVKISIMFPMIVNKEEIIESKKLCRLAMEQLRAEGVPFSEHTKIGIMVETPAAAVCADLLAPYVDFFSIGTNDLIQYTVAADRENPSVTYLTEGRIEAVMRLISHVGRCAGAAGIRAGVCGELAADPSLTEFFIANDITELSVPPSKVLEIREAVMKTDSREAIKKYYPHKLQKKEDV
ncbi:MAG: phosphoenolpyruvate--protein phosphotransferase [Ruminococcaceae bacterium]|nr:phosphoenolpyruvate--protein phosphotransferase [Oscillospiraceae bacterium]